MNAILFNREFNQCLKKLTNKIVVRLAEVWEFSMKGESKVREHRGDFLSPETRSLVMSRIREEIPRQKGWLNPCSEG